MTVSWWLSPDDCHLMIVVWWLSPDDCHLMTVSWWLSADDCRLMTVAWWLQLHNCTVHNLTAELLNCTTNIFAFKHRTPTEYPDEHPSQQTLSRWAIQKVWSVKSNLCSSAFRYLDITTHYHLKLQANPKQNCPKNETKFSCGSFLKFSVRLFEVDFDLHFLLPTLKK